MLNSNYSLGQVTGQTRIFFGEMDRPSFNEHPKHSEKKARIIVASLSTDSTATSRGQFNIIEALQPMPGQHYVAAYERGALISSYELDQEIRESNLEAITARIKAVCRIYPKSCALAFCIHDTTNTFGYILFENEQLMRAV